jgi:hypothetical protein
MTVLIDSGILIEVTRGRDSAILSRWAELSRSDSVLLYSPVTAAELWAAARPSEHRALEGLFRALICLPMDEETGRLAGRYLRQYRKSHGVELCDALIAAAAVGRQAHLWTQSRKSYPMPGLTLI